MQFDIRKLAITSSTNDEARQAAEQGAPEGAVIWALEQRAGRGRQGRVWNSPPGNLYCSVLLRPDVENRNRGHYSFIAALAIGDMVRFFLPAAPVELKWPNDVLVGGKKISGILIEAGQEYLVIGMGVNVLHKPDNPLYPVTSLAAEGAEPPLEAALNRLLQSLDDRCAAYAEQGFAPIRAAWLDQARRGPMRVRLPDEEIHGTFAGLNDQGNLLLTLADGTQRLIHTGDVFL